MVLQVGTRAYFGWAFVRDLVYLVQVATLKYN
jgi:hypothetical protein